MKKIRELIESFNFKDKQMCISINYCKIGDLTDFEDDGNEK